MRLHKQLASAALSAAIAIGICGLFPAQLLAQDTNKSAKRVEQTDKKKARAKQPAASRVRNGETGASRPADARPGLSVDGY